MEPDRKFDLLVELAEEWADCQKCDLCRPKGRVRRNIVVGEGNHDAKLMVIGEAPGEAEDAHGWPFVGPAGELLDDFLAAFNSSRDDVFITNIVMCRPSDDEDAEKNRRPTKEEIEACRPRLHRQIEIIDPVVILLLGDVALKTLSPAKQSITALARSPLFPRIEIVTQGVFGPVVRPGFATFHPAYLLRSESPEDARRKGSDTHRAYETWRKAFSYMDNACFQYFGTPIPQREVE